jgi:AraC family transcriptional regulator
MTKPFSLVKKYVMLYLNNNTVDIWAKLNENENSLVYSSLREFYHPIVTKGFAIKYVLEGCETYEIEGRKHILTDGKYLLSNLTQAGHVQIESNKPVVGFCVNIDTELIKEVVASTVRADTPFPDHTLSDFFTGSVFMDHHFNDKNTLLGKRIKLIVEAICQQKIVVEKQDREIFYFLAESLVQDQSKTFKQLQNIPLKYNTHKDLMRRLLRAKEYLDHPFQQPLMMAQVAQEAYLSEYHFYRLFKNAFGISPNQYLIRNKINHAQLLLKKDTYNITEVATLAGFTDIYSFSKVFKKHLVQTPTGFAKSTDKFTV